MLDINSFATRKSTEEEQRASSTAHDSADGTAAVSPARPGSQNRGQLEAEADEIANRVTSDASGQSSLQNRVAAATGQKLDLQIDSSPAARRQVDAIGAAAFTLRDRVLLGSRAPVAGSRERQHLVAHEMVHVAQQRIGRPMLQADMTHVLNSSVIDASHYSDDEVLEGIQALRLYLVNVEEGSDLATAARDNLSVLVADAFGRGLDFDASGLERVATAHNGGELLSVIDVQAIRARLEIAIDLLQTGVPDEAVEAIQRIRESDQLLPFEAAEDANFLLARADGLISQASFVCSVARSLPDASNQAEGEEGESSPAAQRLADAEQQLRDELRWAVEGLWVEGQTNSFQPLDRASKKYVEALARLISGAVNDALENTPDMEWIDYQSFALSTPVGNGAYIGGHQSAYDALSGAHFVVTSVLEGLVEVAPAVGDPEQSVNYLRDHGEAASKALNRYVALALAFQAAAYSQAVIVTVSHHGATNRDDAFLSIDLALVAKDASELASSDDPSARRIGSLEASYERYKTSAEERFDHLATQHMIITWAGHIVTTILGIRLMNAAIAGLTTVVGRLGLAAARLAGGSEMALGIARGATGATAFLGGTAVFTGYNTLLQAGRSDLPTPTASSIGTQYALDVATFGSLKLAGALVGWRYAAAGRELTPLAVHGTTFVTLMAWSQGMTVYQHWGEDTDQVVSAMASSGAKTAVDLVAIHFGLQFLNTPAVPRNPAATGAELAPTIRAEWESFRTRSRETGERLRRAMEARQRDYGEVVETVGQARSLLREGSDIIRRLHEAGEIPADVATTVREGFAQQGRALESLRLALALRVRGVGEGLLTYRGEAATMEHLLWRLTRDGVLTEVVAAENGAFTARSAEGQTVRIYPEGGRTPAEASTVDPAAEAIALAAPTVSPALRLRAGEHLSGASESAALARITTRLDQAVDAPAVVEFLARPSVGRVMAQSDSAYSVSLIRLMMTDLAVYRGIANIEPATLQRWWHSGYEGSSPRNGRNFVNFLEGMQGFKGDLTVTNAAHARSLAESHRAATSEVGHLTPRPLVQNTGPSVSAVGSSSRASYSTIELIRAELHRMGHTSRMEHITVENETYVVQRSGTGPSGAWRFRGGTLIETIPIETRLREIRREVQRAETHARADRGRAVGILAGVASQVESMRFLTHSRDSALANERSLLLRADPLRFGSASLDPVHTVMTRSEGARAGRVEVVARASQMRVETGVGRATPELRRAVEAVEVVRGRRPNSRSTEQYLESFEGEIASAHAAMDALAEAAVARTRRRLTAQGYAAATADISLTPVRIGEALEATRGMQGFGTAQVRGLLLAAEAGIDTARVLSTARSAAERNRVLDTYGRLSDAGVEGTSAVLESMVRGQNAWRGGVWQFDFVRYRLSDISQVARFEATEIDAGSSSLRIYDIVLRDGRRLEMKDWTNFFEGSMRSQWRRDVRINTEGLTDPWGLLRMQWIFRGLGPTIEGVGTPQAKVDYLRGMMRAELEGVLEAEGVPPGPFMRVFDSHPRPVELIEIDTAFEAEPSIGVLTRRAAPQPEPIPVPPSSARNR